MTRYDKAIIPLLFFAGCLLLAACSTTKNIPDDDQLFIGLTKIDYQNYQADAHFLSTQEEVEAALATAPNGAFFGSSYYRTPFPYGLWIWNYAHGSSGKFKQWLNKSFGKAPVLMSQVNPALRASVAQSVLRKNGYFRGRVSYTEVPQKNPKKAKIGYTVVMDSVTTVDTMAYVGFPPVMQALIDSTRDESLLKPGTAFSVAALDGERTRLTQLFRNNGFYYYSPSYATYLADTFQTAYRAQLRLQMADSIPREAQRPWYVGNIDVSFRKSMREALNDSLKRRFTTFHFNGKRSPLRPRVVMRDMKLRHGRLFSYDDYQQSVQKINATGVFSSVDLQFAPRDRDTLDLKLTCTFDKPYDFYFEANAVGRTIGRVGPAVKFGFTRRNAFHGGEKIDINVHGSYEWQTNGSGNDMNSYQYGADASIEFPRIVAPFIYRERVRRKKDGTIRRPTRFYATPSTIAKASTDIVRRPGYYKMHIVSGEWTYRWQLSESSRHELSPLILKYQFLNSHTEKFDSVISSNPYLMTTMSDYFIPKLRYNYTYSSPSTALNPLRWEITIEESGNVTALYDLLIQGNGWQQKDKTLFKNPYAQFVRIETDLTKTWTLGNGRSLVGHLNAGFIKPYGNSTDAPFSEMFYAGGANSVRAFTVRSIGPGGFKGIPGSRQFNYMMQNGEIKLVANLEYRTRIVDNLHGAIFLDAGNVWNWNDFRIDPSQGSSLSTQEGIDKLNQWFSDTKFRMSRLFDQTALGTGVGLRYDLDFLVIRVDWGFALHAPYDTGHSGYFNLRRFKDMHSLHLAIGYPF